MAISQDETQVGPYRLRCTQLPARKSLKLLRRLGKLVGPPLFKIGAIFQAPEVSKVFAGRKPGSLLDLDTRALGPVLPMLGDALKELMSQLEDRELEELIAALTDGMEILGEDGKAAALNGAMFDRLFSGADLALIPQVLAFALATNYGSFFDAIQGAIAAVLPAAPATTPPPSPST